MYTIKSDTAFYIKQNALIELIFSTNLTHGMEKDIPTHKCTHIRGKVNDNDDDE